MLRTEIAWKNIKKLTFPVKLQTVRLSLQILRSVHQFIQLRFLLLQLAQHILKTQVQVCSRLLDRKDDNFFNFQKMKVCTYTYLGTDPK